MATDLKRFSISVTDEMEVRLDKMKQIKYYKTSKNKMIQDLLCIGLDVMQKEMDSLGQSKISTNFSDDTKENVETE